MVLLRLREHAGLGKVRLNLTSAAKILPFLPPNLLPILNHSQSLPPPHPIPQSLPADLWLQQWREEVQQVSVYVFTYQIRIALLAPDEWN